MEGGREKSTAVPRMFLRAVFQRLAGTPATQSLNDDTKILTETDTKTFFCDTKFSETETETFLRDQIFPKPKPILFF